ncbi:hypothetical protein [Flavobacterium aquatile]|uniref:Uncharacterized protein n=1 Tax=Flavobacterium aquatile LMG 4008 = ATCC 11947 TaxID=1453498 RepID=A0A095U4N8_9FLAO|nr:hypothetical protein [Flavobacterium aquatile]KGD69583.1 hypothetical protein LG45_02140 [Flavobacterium aquatile LMG 4008 = ATCC 11947]OXA67282.1 hypothetical protein B0A61_08735 [Flavobacterium aquatile LMG 4008 = ATCC 11947]GEC77941.1 hypothetical protein FAQ01_08110 [Flavobacterium aquatile]
MRKNEIIYLLLGIVLLFTSVYLFTRPAIFSDFDLTKTGPIGDTIGGITAPLINLIGAYLVYISFKAQVSANKIQLDTLSTERIRYERENNFQMQVNHFNEIKNAVNNLEFIIDSKTIYDFSGERTYRDPVNYKGINALNEFTKRLNRYNFRDEIYDLYGMLLNFEFILLTINELLENVDRQILFVEDKKYFFKNINIYFDSFILPFAITISKSDRLENYDIDKIENLTNLVASKVLKFKKQIEDQKRENQNNLH